MRLKADMIRFFLEQVSFKAHLPGLGFALVLGLGFGLALGFVSRGAP